MNESINYLVYEFINYLYFTCNRLELDLFERKIIQILYVAKE